MAGETVTVACKLPHGLVLRVFKMVDAYEPVLGGGTRKISISQELPERAVVAGFSHAQNMAPKAPMSHGFALTSGISKELWDLWFAQNKDSMMVRNGLIFAHIKPESTTAESREKKDQKSGLERLDPKKLPARIQQSDLMKAV